MRNLKIYEEFSLDDLDDLASGLSNLGLAKKVEIFCTVGGGIPNPNTNPYWWPTYLERFAIVEFPDRGSESSNKNFALQKIRKGEFYQILDTSEDPEFKGIVDPEIIKITSKENIQKISLKVPTLDLLLKKVRDEINLATIKIWEKLQEKNTLNMSDSDLSVFYSTKWRSSPKKVREELERNFVAEIRIEEV